MSINITWVERDYVIPLTYHKLPNGKRKKHRNLSVTNRDVPIGGLIDFLYPVGKKYISKEYIHIGNGILKYRRWFPTPFGGII